jgi:hypothetical protein
MKNAKSMSYRMPDDIIVHDSGHLTAAFLKQAGVDVAFAPLGERGIHGNRHMMMLEKNNDVIAEFIHRWVLGNI